MLAVSVAAQAGASVAINGPAFLIPQLQDDRGLSLAQAGTVAAAPIAGVMVTLFVWGLVVDRIGERAVLLAGPRGYDGPRCRGRPSVDSTLALVAVLFVTGMFAACTGSASGRIVVGWFPPQRRGLAMGIRQMAQPLGVAVAAATIAVVAERAGVSAALWIPVAATALAGLAVAVLVIDPPRPAPTDALTANPYRADRFLARVHGVSVLLVVPQFLVWTYSLTWLVQERHWSAAAAGALIAVTHVLGSAAAGSPWASSPTSSGRASARCAGSPSPPRVTMGLLALTEPFAVAVVLMVVASTVTVADNGLAFTSVAERAGSYWSGRALGIQNTAQYLTAAAVAPVAGVAITHWGYAATYALSALCPVIALPLVPKDDGTSAE